MKSGKYEKHFISIITNAYRGSYSREEAIELCKYNRRHNKALPLTKELRNELVIEANKKAFSLGEYK